MNGRGCVTSAQDGGLGGAGPTLAERALARFAGVLHEAGDTALPGFGPGKPDSGGLQVWRPLSGISGSPPPPQGSGT